MNRFPVSGQTQIFDMGHIMIHLPITCQRPTSKGGSGNGRDSRQIDSGTIADPKARLNNTPGPRSTQCWGRLARHYSSVTPFSSRPMHPHAGASQSPPAHSQTLVERKIGLPPPPRPPLQPPPPPLRYHVLLNVALFVNISGGGG